MTDRTRELLDLLTRNPDGLTAGQAARATNAKPATVGSRLSKMAMYGQCAKLESDANGKPTIYLPLPEPA